MLVSKKLELKKILIHIKRFNLLENNLKVYEPNKKSKYINQILTKPQGEINTFIIVNFWHTSLRTDISIKQTDK